MPAPALPRFPELAAPASWQAIDLLSDIHLHADQPGTFEAWRHHLLNTPADAVLILGDLFEVWVGDEVLDGVFERACTEVLEQAGSSRFVGFMPGNRDFLVGAELLARTGARPLADPTLLLAFGRRTLLSHGDALCLDDVDYQRFRTVVRGADWQREFLARPLAERRELARAMRDASTAHQASVGPAGWADADPTEMRRWLQAADAQALVHGHTHRPADQSLAPGLQRHVLSDWSFDGGCARGDVLRLTAQGLQRLPPDSP